MVSDACHDQKIVGSGPWTSENLLRTFSNKSARSIQVGAAYQATLRRSNQGQVCVGGSKAFVGGEGMLHLGNVQCHSSWTPSLF